MKALFWSVFTLSLMVGPLTNEAAAQGDRDGSIRGARPEVHAILSMPRLFGVGARVDITLLEDGLLDNVNDELALSPGADLLFFRPNDSRGDEWGIWPVVALQWNFYLPRRWSLFPELGAVALVHYRPHGALFSPFLTIGARWHFSARNALLMRLGYPAGFQVGITL